MKARATTRLQSSARSDLHFIAPVPPQDLSKACSMGRMDESSKQIRDHEWQSYIQERRRRYNNSRRHEDPKLPDLGSNAPDDLAGIALSSGGIRSATFALGVLQALAHHDLLRRFDYLSTVSGGGYIGTSLTWLTSKPVADRAKAQETAVVDGPEIELRLFTGTFGLRPSRISDNASEVREAAPFPYGSDDPRTASKPDGTRPTDAMLRYLRQRGNYLMPGKGITFVSVVVVLLRHIILMLLVWIPIIAALMWALIWLSVPQVWDLVLPAPAVDTGRAPEWLVDFVGNLSPPLNPGDPDSPALFAFGALLAFAVYLFAICVAAFAAFSLATFSSRRPNRWSLGGGMYLWRRGFERQMRLPLQTIGLLVLLASVPVAVAELQGWLVSPSFSLLGLAGGLLAFGASLRHSEGMAQKWASWANPSSWIGAALLLYGVLVFSFGYARWMVDHSAVFGSILWINVAIAIVIGLFVDLNLISTDRYYGDRLMETFLPDLDGALRNETGPAAQADSVALSSMCDPSHAIGPYHIINTTLMLTASEERTYRMRRGDSFILSSLYCGSNATGWQPTEEFVDNELTLSTAMTISASAANPWINRIGLGVVQHPLAGMLVALVNAGLGFWLPNPNEATRLEWWRRSCKKSFRPNFFEPGLKEVLGANLREHSPVCLLSDGGYFDNLGLYELIRRRVRLIVLCDSTVDPDYVFADLHNSSARVWIDFGARIEFDRETTLHQLMPSIDAVYPKDVRLSECAYAVAQITYSDNCTGYLVYLKAVLSKGVRLKLMGYKAANRNFPEQSTADQFFDDAQFEAYRELGYGIAESFILHDMRSGGILVS